MRREKGDKRKDNDSKPEDKDSNTGGTAGAHIEDTTTTEEYNAPSGAPSIGIHVSEINLQSSRSPRTIEEILGVHSMNDDDFWSNTNPADVSIDTVNSKEMMAASHIIKSYTDTNTKNQLQLSY